MNAAPPGPDCLDAEQLEAAASGATLPQALRDHLASCESCAARLAVTVADDALLADFRQANAAALAGPEPFAHIVGPDGYDVQDVIGEGAQGLVYRATQRATRRRVALKVLRAGAFSSDRQHRRFEREVELVASLRHPGIVSVYDSGIDGSGRPWIAMEYVEGQSLAAWGSVSPARSVSAVIEMIEAIGRAVGAAHRRGIIHRDLKPANIIVDKQGQPRVFDFGVAKPIDAPRAATLRTVAGEFLGTLAYAAPEQVSDEPVDTRADLFALGVIAFELLAGRRPRALEGGLADIVRAVAETPCDSVRRWRPEVDRDLERVLATALALDRDERYETVDAFIADLRHWRSGEPVAVRRQERVYVLRKTAWRYRYPLAAAAAVGLGVLAFGITVFVMYRQVQQARDEMAGTLSTAMALIGSIDRENLAAPVTVRRVVDLVDRGAVIADNELADLPHVAASLHMSVGRAYLSLSRFDRAEHHYHAARALFRKMYSGDHPALAGNLHELGRLAMKRCDYAGAERYYEDALAMRKRLYSGPHPDVALTMQHVATSARRQGRLRESIERCTAALEMAEQLEGGGGLLRPSILVALGNCLADYGDDAAAAAHYARAVELTRGLIGADDIRLAAVIHNQAYGLINLGDLDAAERVLDESLAIKRELVGDSDPQVLRAQQERARLELARGRVNDARRLVERVLAFRAGAQPEPSHEHADALELRGALELAAGDAEAALPYFEAAIAMCHQLYGDGHWKIGRAQLAAARCHRLSGRPQEARAALAEAMSCFREVAPDAPLRRQTAELARFLDEIAQTGDSS